ncbi:MAG: DUF2721 domain-containing protein [Planctomycetota bacterium]
MPVEDPGVIQQLVAPAVMIPACGLLLLSSTARMNTVLARVRAFHSERLDVWRSEHEAGTRHDRVRTLRLEGLQRQTDRLLVRASLLRATMVQLFCAVVCNLVTVIGLALRLVVSEEPTTVYVASVWVFMCGIVFMLGAMVTSVLEVKRILETVRYEHERVESLCGSEPPSDGNATQPPPGALGRSMGEGMGL